VLNGCDNFCPKNKQPRGKKIEVLYIIVVRRVKLPLADESEGAKKER
jgi:hypothetical protein